MNIKEFYERRELLNQSVEKFRQLCNACMQPDFSCYCRHVQKFNPKIKFAILIHPIEVKRRIATGRMAHLCLENSVLISGQDYTNSDRVNAILENPRYQPLVLYPGRNSTNLSQMAAEQRVSLLNQDKEPVIFVIDGTWATARKMIRLSKNLHSVPRICFTPEGASQFRVRKQPAPECFSTIEAIHQTIDLIGPAAGFTTQAREHDKLLYVFNKMVERQLEFIRISIEDPSRSKYRPRYRTRGIA